MSFEKKNHLDFPPRNSIFPMKLKFLANLCKFYILKFLFEEKICIGWPFYGILLLSEIRRKWVHYLTFPLTKKLVFRTGETLFQSAETRFENAETL